LKSSAVLFLVFCSIGVHAGQLSWAYNPAGQPSQFSEQQMLQAIDSAIKAWGACGVTSGYQGITSQTPQHARDNLSVFGWSSSVAKNGVSGQGYTMFSTRNGYILPGADVLLSASALVKRPNMLTRTLSHEVGHVVGFSRHSQSPSSLMYVISDNTSSPSDQDIKDCQSFNVH